MKPHPSHPFRPFRREPTTPVLPAWAIDKLDHPQLPEVPDVGSLSTYIQPFINASGLSLGEICQRMQHPICKTLITPKLLEESLTSYSMETWIACRLFKALEVPWDGYRLYQEEQSSRHDKALKTRWDAEYHINYYRRHGPCLHALQTTESWCATAGFADPYHLTRQVKAGATNNFNPPDVEQMAAIIRAQPETCAHPHAQVLHIIGGYLYHRFPDELHLFDAQGRILASGGITLPLPGHMMLTRPRRAHLSPRKTLRPPIAI